MAANDYGGEWYCPSTTPATASTCSNGGRALRCSASTAGPGTTTATVPVVAHSMGCVVAAAALARYPELFTSVVLVNPGPLCAGHRMPPPGGPRPEVGHELARAGIAGTPRSAKEAAWAWRIRFAGVNLFHVDRWRQVAGGQVFYKPEVATAVRSTMPPGYDYVGDLQRHAHPVTMVVGDHDFVDPGARRAEAAASGAVRTVVLHEAGHSAWVDQPQAFTEAVEQALDR